MSTGSGLFQIIIVCTIIMIAVSIIFNDTADSSKDKFMVKQKKWNGPAIYQVRMIGRLGSQWTNWFEGLSIKCQGKTTILTGRIVDQSALHGLLAKIRDLGMPIISVSRFETDIDHNME